MMFKRSVKIVEFDSFKLSVCAVCVCCRNSIQKRARGHRRYREIDELVNRSHGGAKKVGSLSYARRVQIPKYRMFNKDFDVHFIETTPPIQTDGLFSLFFFLNG
jgi:hypothetical protein